MLRAFRSISAVGHEIDVTLADLVADVRALTPSEAAERVVPAMDAIYRNLRDQKSRLENALRSRSSEARRRLEAIENRRPFKKPFDQLHDRSQQLEWWQTRSARAVMRFDGAHQKQIHRAGGEVGIAQPGCRSCPRLQFDNESFRWPAGGRRPAIASRRHDAHSICPRFGGKPGGATRRLRRLGFLGNRTFSAK